jgi:hypothetical protein
MEKRDIAVLCAYTIILLLFFFCSLMLFWLRWLVKEERNQTRRKMKDERCSCDFFVPFLSLYAFFPPTYLTYIGG